MRYLFVVGILAILVVPVMGCGGFFCTTTPIDQNAERIIFTVNGDGTMTAVVGITYVGAAEDFSWVVPVPSPPELSVAETASIDLLQTATNKNIQQPANYCDNLVNFPVPVLSAVAEEGAGFLETGSVGPYDYAIIGSEDPDEMVTWLRDNGYRITEEMEPLVTHYVDGGMYFLAMKLSQDSDVGDIQPVVMTYNSTKPMIPLKLTAVAAVPNMPVIVWIFGDAQYIPENYAHPEVDYSTFSQLSQIRDTFSSFNPPLNQYFSALTALQSEYDGKAFVTEYAQPTSTLAQTISGDTLLDDLIQRFPYVTRLRAQLSPEQMTLDPTFITAPDAANVSNVVLLDDHVDPLHYWGCSSRTIRVSDDRLEQFARLDFEGNPTHIGYPAGWVMSEIEMETIGKVYIFAPEAVDEARVWSVLTGETELPLFLATDATPTSSEPPVEIATDLHSETREHYRLFGSVDNPTEGMVRLGVVAKQSVWEQYQSELILMLNYADSYQFFAHPDLRHTLFLKLAFGEGAGNGFELPQAAIGYADGWTEWLVEADGDVEAVITPDDDAEVRARFIPMGRFGATSEALKTPLMERYAISEDTFNALTETATVYERDGRKGYLKLSGFYILDLSAPAEKFDQYEAVFGTMLEAFVPDPAQH